MAVRLEDSNMALFGTEVEKNLKYNNAQNEPEWHTIPKEPCLMIWRIENVPGKFGVAAWPKDRYGSFYQGDSYIVLSVTQDEGSALEYTAYMWVGKESTQDETGTAAYKIVELDDFFHGAVDLVYEAQGNETEEFRDLFEDIVVMEGGSPSGFKKVQEDIYKPRLLQVFRQNKTAVSEEVPMKISSLNEEDGFILDLGMELHEWRGSKATAFLKFDCVRICQKIKKSRNDKPKIFSYDEGDKGTKALMEKHLENDMEGKQQKVVLRAGRRAKPAKVDKKMFRLSDESGTLKLTETEFSKDKLDTKDAFLIDNGKLYIWVGKGCSPNERKNSLNYVKEYAKQSGKNVNVSIVILKEGSKKFKIDSVFK